MGKWVPHCHRVSRLFQPTSVVPVGAEVKHNDLLAKSNKLMLDRGVIAASQNGFFYLLPLATRALDKLIRLVEDTMTNLGAQKIFCPTLTGSDIWRKTDRLSAVGSELFHLKDRHNKDYILNPTHEESVTQLFASLPPLSYKRLPLLLYQITSKFRDEIKPRHGLIRTREFVMKDLYSFDSTLEAAESSYDLVSHAYHRIFETLGVKFLKVKGVPGEMGGQVSHEFHFPADIGDDTLLSCNSCEHSWNRDTSEGSSCQQCGSNNVTSTKGIEVGHTFLLDTRYSTPLQALYSGVKGKDPLVMGSYGLGLTRILAASLEVLSLPDQLRWPSLLAPYTLVIITPKEGSKESKNADHLPEELYWSLQEVPELENNVIIDDRSQLTIGKRMQEARWTGYPYIAVVGKAASQPTPLIELHNVYTEQSSLHCPADLVTALVTNSQQPRISVSQ